MQDADPSRPPEERGEPDTPSSAEAVDAGSETIVVEQPRQIGPYVVVRMIGQGGMGSVFEAVRADDQFRKRVAIKLMYTGAHDRQLQERFRLERQILANLEHPNIARLLDGGTLPNGMPYLVMEYVEGMPIDRFAEEHKLDLDARLSLMRKVFDAVSYAHSNLVVHRDLKPANILVTAESEPKLVDFGIAKLLDPSGAGDLTRTLMVALTPEYASPEQVRGEPTTIATDIYALGAMLYELLTSRRLLTLKNTSLRELEKAICLTEPSKPSAVVARSQPLVAKKLAGDLDTIVLKALRKAPAERYATVERLDEDVRRYMKGLPIAARPTSFRYRSAKFVRRHPVASISAISALVLVLLFGITMAILARHLAIERDRATEEQAKAQQVSQFLVNIFKVSNPEESPGGTVTARMLLDQGSKTIGQQLSNQPKVQATMLDTMAQAYQGLGLYERAESLYTQALDVREHRMARDENEIAHNFLNIATEMNNRDAEYAKAETMARKAYQHFEADGAPAADKAACLRLLGKLARSQGRYADAAKLNREALAADMKIFGPSSAEAAQDDSDLGAAMYELDDLPQATRFFRQSLAIRTKLFGEQSARTLDSMEGLGLVLDLQGKFSESETLLRKVLDGRRHNYGEYHHGTAVAIVNLADLMSDEKKWDEARALYLEALQVQRRVSGNLSASVAGMENELALLAREEQHYPEAEANFRDACNTFSKTLGEQHPHFALCLQNLAGVLLKENRLLGEAETDLSRALDINVSKFGTSDRHVVNTLVLLAQVRDKRSNEKGANLAYQNALKIVEGNPAITPDLRALVELRYGAYLNRQHQMRLARPMLEDALALESKAHGPKSKEVEQVQHEISLATAH